MNLELTQKENEIIERTFGSVVTLDSNFNVVEDILPIDASYMLKPSTNETLEDFKQKIVEMRTGIMNIKIDAESLKFPTLSKEYLDSRRPIGRIGGSFTYRHTNYGIGPSYLKITALKFKKNKKTKLDILGSFAYVKNELGLKVVIPIVSDILIHGVEKDYELRPQYTFILGGTYYAEIELTNPRVLRHTNYIVCDIKYKNGGAR